MAVVMKQITFIDSEVVPDTGKISDFGAIRPNGEYIHSASLDVIRGFLLETDFLCGHNIIAHDLKYLNKYLVKDFIVLKFNISTLFIKNKVPKPLQSMIGIGWQFVIIKILSNIIKLLWLNKRM